MKNKIDIKTLGNLTTNEELIEIGRVAVQDMLIEFRDSRLSSLDRGNGLVIKEPDGTPSSAIRFGFEMGFRIALNAIIEHLEKDLCEHGNDNKTCKECKGIKKLIKKSEIPG